MVALHVLAPVASVVSGAWRLLALAPVATGIALNLSADRAFRRAGTTVKPGLPSTALVTGGVFAWTRHPMYLGLFLLLAGVWCALGSVTPGIAVAAFAGVVDRWFVHPEEEKLERTFGRVYEDYRARVGRWL
jgi:protein-S-isoprenylcysteine O-methyltransferase Ste14